MMLGLKLQKVLISAALGLSLVQSPLSWAQTQPVDETIEECFFAPFLLPPCLPF
ncbi:hypothetical protein [Cupriavidus necator]